MCLQMTTSISRYAKESPSRTRNLRRTLPTRCAALGNEVEPETQDIAPEGRVVPLDRVSVMQQF